MASEHRLRIIRYVLAMLVAFAALIGAAFFAYGQANKVIESMTFEAGAESLEETYKNVGLTFTEVSRSRWNYLEQMASYLELSMATNGDIGDLSDRLKQNNFGATDFYLISESGNYRTLENTTGYIDLGSSLFSLVDDGEEIIADGSLPNRENMIFYAVPVKENTYNGFTYSAIALGYDKVSMGESLQITAYDGQSKSYLVYSNGRVAFSMGDDQLGVSNFISFMEQHGASTDTLASINQSFSSQSTDTVQVDIDGEPYYVSYQPAGTQNLMLVSFTPEVAVNKSINNISSFMSRVLAIIILLVSAIVVAAIMFFFRRSIKKQSEALEEKDLIFSMMSEDMNSIYILLKGYKHEVLYVSPNVKRLLGINAQDVYDDPSVLDACRISDSSASQSKDIIDTLKQGETYREECELMSRSTGLPTMFLFEMYRPIGKHANLVMAVLSDRTEEENRRRQLRDALDAANSASDSKSQFLANMSHDIRTPMNAILGFASLAEGSAENPNKVREYTKKINASGKHLLSLINDILDMSKIEAGKTTLELEPVDIAEVVQEATDLMLHQAEQKNLDFQTNFDLQPAAIVNADKLRLNQILINILSNAVKYTPDGGKVLFAVDRIDAGLSANARYRFVVSDNGIGLSEAFVENIFSSFSREERSVTNKIQGTGLGMAITKNLVDLMGGSISVQSKQNVGSTFTVVLQFALADKNEVAAAAAAAGSAASTGGAGAAAAAAAGSAASGAGATGAASATAAAATGATASTATSATATPTSTSATPQNYSIAGLHILAAEDNELNAELLADLMEIEEANCTIVENGQELVNRFEASAEGEFDVILTDIQMPVMDGNKAAELIRASAHAQATSIPIIAMSAAAFSDDVAAALASGMNAHVSKPLDMEVLKKTVVELLGD